MCLPRLTRSCHVFLEAAMLRSPPSNGLRESLPKGSHKHELLSLQTILKSTSTLIHLYNNILQQNVASYATLVSALPLDTTDKSQHKLDQPPQTLNTYTLVHLLRTYSNLGLDSYCQQLHTHILKRGLTSDSSVSNSLIRFYRLQGSLTDAHKLFDEITQPNVVAWNSLISGYVKSGLFRRGLSLFLQLNRSDTCADVYSYSTALAACGQLSLLQLGRSTHCNVVKCGMESGVVANCLIDMYGKCNSLEEAITIFNYMIDKDIVSWNSIIAACARDGRLDLAYSFFSGMTERDIISYNELINGIAQCGNIDDAIEVLFNMQNPNSSSWNCIITGYVNRNQPRQALDFFVKMHASNAEMDSYTFSVLLSGIAALAALQWGIMIHCCTIKQGLDKSVVVGSSLIDMYAKCGQVNNANFIFRSLPEKNLVTWNAMISGYAHNGYSSKVIELFEEMKMARSLKPDWVTFLNVMAIFSNDEVPVWTAIHYFESMINEYEIEPEVEHCCSIIRLMGQKGNVRKAVKIIYELGFGPSGVVWKALLGACGACKDLKVATMAAAKVIELEGGSDYVYVMLSNILAYYGKWESVRKVRELMNERGLRKEVGCSWTEIACL